MSARVLLAIIGLIPCGLYAGQVDINGQIRPRHEFRDPAPGGGDDSFTSMRTRIQAKAELPRQVGLLIQLQDVRLWGQETSTLGDFSADYLDLHQGYVEFGQFYGLPLDVRLGRQEISLGGQRLVGAVGWTPQGRAFDGVRLVTRTGGGTLTLLGIRLADRTAADIDNNAYLTGAYAALSKLRDLELFVFYNSAGSATDQFTFGFRQANKAKTLVYRIEAAYQTGDRGDQEVAAYMVGLRVGAALAEGKLGIALWYDRLSGDGDLTDGETKVFDTLFATNHKFYGHADYFLNIPVHTAGRGLQDLALKCSFAPVGVVKLAAALHRFSLAEKNGLASGHLGEEIDLSITCRYSENVVWVGGFSYVIAADAFGDIGRLDENAAFAYLSTNVMF